MNQWIWSLILLAITFVIYKAYRTKYYFSKWGIPQVVELPFLSVMYSNFPPLHVNNISRMIYNTHKEAKYIGCHMFMNPVIALRDLDLIKIVLVKSFDHFADHPNYISAQADPLLGGNLLFMNGERWREVRNLLSPSFTSNKMRTMYVLMSCCANSFTETFLQRFKHAEAIDIKDAFNRYANDVIATCAFGLEVNSLQDPENEFYVRSSSAADLHGMKMLKIMLAKAMPFLNLRIVSQEDTDFFVSIIKNTIEERKKNGITRPDMLQLMMNAREDFSLNLMQMAAHAFLFFLAGFDATSTQISMMAYELATHPEIQRELQAEVDAVMEASKGQPSYETVVNDMPYLEAVFCETMRRHSTSFLNIMCSKEYEMPPALAGAKPFIMKPGMEVLVPIVGIHYDPQYYPDPEKFDPTRFLNKKATHADGLILGFGMGPRNCIGNRFVILEAKTLFVHMVYKCNFMPCKKTCIPLEYCTKTFSAVPKGGCWLRAEPRR